MQVSKPKKSVVLELGLCLAHHPCTIKNPWLSLRALAEFRPLNDASLQVARKSPTQLARNPFNQLAKKPGTQMARKSTTQLPGFMQRSSLLKHSFYTFIYRVVIPDSQHF